MDRNGGWQWLCSVRLTTDGFRRLESLEASEDSGDALGELKDELEEYKKQLDAVKDDLRFVIEETPQILGQIQALANQSGNNAYDQTRVARAKEFLEKYSCPQG